MMNKINLLLDPTIKVTEHSKFDPEINEIPYSADILHKCGKVLRVDDPPNIEYNRKLNSYIYVLDKKDVTFNLLEGTVHAFCINGVHWCCLENQYAFMTEKALFNLPLSKRIGMMTKITGKSIYFHTQLKNVLEEIIIEGLSLKLDEVGVVAWG